MSVYLLSRKGRRGKSSLFLVHYNKGKRSHQFLKLYTYDRPKDATEREHNREVMRLAKHIKAQKELDAQFSQHHAVSPVKEKVGLLQFFQKVMKQKGHSPGWSSAYLHLKNYLKGDDVPLSLIDGVWLSNYQTYLMTAPISRGGRLLARNSSVCYYVKLAVVLKAAVLQRYLRQSPTEHTKAIKPLPTNREFLTYEELQKLAATECQNPELKKCFLWAVFTGLRWSDASSIKWGDIRQTSEGGYYLLYTQKKTKKQEQLPIHPYAISLIGERGLDGEKVFNSLHYSSYLNVLLKQWVLRAGILKKISFHNPRVTFASLQLSAGTDLFVISKLLGHSTISVTQGYTKLHDRLKIEAVNRIQPLSLLPN